MTVGVALFVGVAVGVGVADGDGSGVGLACGVGLIGTGVWFTGVGNVPTVLAVGVPVTPGDGDIDTGGVGDDFLPNGPDASTTVTVIARPLTISCTVIICCPVTH